MVASSPSYATFPPPPPDGTNSARHCAGANQPALRPGRPSDGMVASSPFCPTVSSPPPDGTNSARHCAGANQPALRLGRPSDEMVAPNPFCPTVSPPTPDGTNSARHCAGAKHPRSVPAKCVQRDREEGPRRMDPDARPPRAARPRTTRLRVTDLSWLGPRNPSPLVKDTPTLVQDDYLSPARLLEMTQADDLGQVRTLQMRVDTRENSLGNFGDFLPSLDQLKLNNSLLASVRDLGTSLAQLRVLWVARCGLEDLDGISSFASLKELYASYNNISELSPLCLLDQLEVLDLEGNNVDDVAQVQLLGLCGQLHTLTLQGNLVCLRPRPRSPAAPDYNYRAEVRRLIPHLHVLDDVPASRTSPRPSGVPTVDWLVVQEAIKKGHGGPGPPAGPAPRQGSTDGRPGPGPRRASTVPISSGSGPWQRQRRRRGSPGPDRPHVDPPRFRESPLLETLFTDDTSPDEDDASDLTHGFGHVLCGNPIKALHERRRKLKPLPPCRPFPAPEDSPEEEEDTPEELPGPGHVLAQLRAWQKQHRRCPLNSQAWTTRGPPLQPLSPQAPLTSLPVGSRPPGPEETVEAGHPVGGGGVEPGCQPGGGGPDGGEAAGLAERQPDRHRALGGLGGLRLHWPLRSRGGEELAQEAGGLPAHHPLSRQDSREDPRPARRLPADHQHHLPEAAQPAHPHPLLRPGLQTLTTGPPISIISALIPAWGGLPHHPYLKSHPSPPLLPPHSFLESLPRCPPWCPM
ncbi:leucine-rich repeat-containing protein 56 [Tachyglossus aculeatus]|uniref:leucine-rich repeat-containing protein 56 n=1 Tax=Tachyglossus aculeatus TaxID=9261 RepID=UPI0018F426D1|nr:leucine-rich repeat-containing protein 56 [Tachyglossus aculeatus]